MFTYADGTIAEERDVVEYEGERGSVESVIDAQEMMAFWGVEEQGLMLKAPSFGLVFVPCQDSSFTDSLRFIERGK